jgi:hypothetical protein
MIQPANSPPATSRTEPRHPEVNPRLDPTLEAPNPILVVPSPTREAQLPIPPTDQVPCRALSLLEEGRQSQVPWESTNDTSEVSLDSGCWLWPSMR